MNDNELNLNSNNQHHNRLQMMNDELVDFVSKINMIHIQISLYFHF